MGKLYLVGMGPGDAANMTGAARAALEEAELFCGYTRYVNLLRPLFPEKTFYATGMTGELERCRYCLERASEGICTALICSGDAGIYGMAGPTLELSTAYPKAEITVIPGVTAACSGAALLGAPLGHDFCVISLSDRLTDWGLIEKRLRCASEGDFVVCLYNPASRHRPDCLRKACEVLLEKKAPDTVCGVAKNIGREGENVSILTLEELKNSGADMFTTVFIGSFSTKTVGSRMVTPRGYRK